MASAAPLSVPDTVPSTDATSVVVHELAGLDGAHHQRVLIAHATGFHAMAYLPMAMGLAPRFHSFGLDFRGHGDTAAPPGWVVDWTGYGDDALAAAEHVVEGAGAEDGLVGFGHSMGGATLLMAAFRSAELFRLLVLFEPIVFPPSDTGTPDGPPSSLPDGARRRRRTFPSMEAAIANYGSKPPLDAFDPMALDAYVRHGFAPDVEADGVRLKCDPEHEAQTFEQGGVHRTWEILPAIATPVVVVTGRIEDPSPALMGEPIAERLPAGRFVSMPALDHFGPMTHPALVADMVTSCVDQLDDPGSW